MLLDLANYFSQFKFKINFFLVKLLKTSSLYSNNSLASFIFSYILTEIGLNKLTKIITY